LARATGTRGSHAKAVQIIGKFEIMHIFQVLFLLFPPKADQPLSHGLISLWLWLEK